MKAPEPLKHESAIELLPWLLNGSMDSAEQKAVRAHADSCVVCRRELNALQALQELVAGDKRNERFPAPDMRNINARIDRLIENRSWRQRFLSWSNSRIASPWKLAFAIQSLLVIVLAAALMWPSAPEPQYTTLTQPEDLSKGHHVRVVFRPETTLSELNALLNEMALTVENGPSPQGVYTLAVSEDLGPQGRAQLLMQLERQPVIQFAQEVVHPDSMDQ